MMRRTAWSLLPPTAALFAFLSGCTAPSPPPPLWVMPPLERLEVDGVRPLSRVGSLYLAGQPDRAAFEELKARGVELVVDLRHPEEDHRLDEPALMEDLGLELVVRPVTGPDDLTSTFFDELRALLVANEDRTVLLHCGSSNRVGAAWLAKRVLDDGVAWSRALQEARASGLRSDALAARTRAYVRGAADRRFDEIEQEIRASFPDVETITVAELAQRLRDGTAPPLLDVRTREEYAVSHLPHAGRATTIEESFAVLDGVSQDREVVVYCSVGYRSAELARALRAQGFTNVKNLEGSIFEWANEGHPLEREGLEVGVVHPFDENWGELLDPARRAELR